MSKKLITGITGIILTTLTVWYGFSNPQIFNLRASSTNLSPSPSQSISDKLNDSDSPSKKNLASGLELAQTGSNSSNNQTTTEQILDALKHNTVVATGLDVGEGTITASNIIYSIKAGDGISVSKGQYPTISNTGVLSIGGKKGIINLDDNGGILFDNQKLYNADKGSTQNIFKTIAVTDHSDIKADSNSTTLHIAAGNGISLDTSDTDKKLTISATGGNTGWVDDGTTVRLQNDSDKVGIGTVNPTSQFSIGASSQFQVDNNGNIVKINNIDYSFPSSQGAAGTVLTNNGSGGLSWNAGGGAIAADSLDFTDFKDAMALDADTNIALASHNFTFNGTGNVGIGRTNPVFTLDVGGKIGINGTQVVYLPNQSNFLGTLIVGDSGLSLSHSSGSEGQLNTFVGIGTGTSTTTGASNTIVGYQSLFSNTTGGANTAIGDRALYSNTSGKANLAAGQGALYFNTTGGNNVALGHTALNVNTTGNNNVAVGSGALKANTTGSESTAVGLNSSWKNTTGTANTSFGFGALLNNTTGLNNTAIGWRAVQGITTGSNNTALGNFAGTNLTTGSNNIIIGYSVNTPTATSSNTLNIGNLVFGINLDGTGPALSTGNIGIGTTNPAFKFEVAGNIGPSIDSSGSGVGYNIGSSSKRYDTVYASNGTINTSDQRLKTNITNLNYGLDALMQLQPVSFNWTSNPSSGTKLGLIAQQVQKVIPEVVKVGDDENHTLGIYYSDLIPVTIKGIQEQQGRIQELGLQLSLLDKTVKTISGTSSDLTTEKVQEATISGALTLNTLTVKGDSIFEKTVTFMGEVIHNAEVSFKGTVSFFAKAVFHSDVDLQGNTTISKTTIDQATIKKANITFDNNAVGIALIHKASRDVIVTFDREYEHTPSVNISINVSKNNDKAAQDTIEEQILQNDIKYIATDVTTKGFTIKLNKNAPADLSFSWMAFASSDIKTFESQQNTAAPTSIPTAIPSPTGITLITPASVETLSPTVTLSPTLIPSPTTPDTTSVTPSASPTP